MADGAVYSSGRLDVIGSKMRRKRSVQAENRRSHLDEHEELEAAPEDADADA